MPSVRLIVSLVPLALLFAVPATMAREFERLTDADQQRLDALTTMFARHGYPAPDALVRARVLYFTQIGHYTLGITEDDAVRFSRLRAYCAAFCGQEPTDAEVERFRSVAVRNH